MSKGKKQSLFTLIFVLGKHPQLIRCSIRAHTIILELHVNDSIYSWGVIRYQVCCVVDHIFFNSTNNVFRGEKIVSASRSKFDLLKKRIVSTADWTSNRTLKLIVYQVMIASDFRTDIETRLHFGYGIVLWYRLFV